MTVRGSLKNDNFFELSPEEERQPMASHLKGRELEDVDYWRKRAGWFDDDTSMKDYNTGVYSSYYSADDDKSSSTKASRKSIFSSFSAPASGTLFKVGMGIFAAIVVLMVIRIIAQRSSRHKSSKSSSRSLSRSRRRGESRSRRSNSRSRSKSRTRSSRSKSRSRRSDMSDGNYELMSDDGEKSRKSRSSRSRSKSKSRSSRSKSRSKGTREEMLV